MQRRWADTGFTLVELLVVVIVIGILASIAIPVFMAQREKAHDSSTKADVGNVGKEIASYYVDNAGPLQIDLTQLPGRVILHDAHGFHQTVNVTNGTAAPLSGATAGLADPTGWCIALTDPHGRQKEYKFSARAGLEPGTCP